MFLLVEQTSYWSWGKHWERIRYIQNSIVEQYIKGVAIKDSDRKWARQDAFLEIKRGLARAGLKLAELRKDS